MDTDMPKIQSSVSCVKDTPFEIWWKFIRNFFSNPSGRQTHR